MMTNDVFKPHGYFSITVESDVLIVDSVGPFNIELVVKYREALEEKIAGFDGRQWRQIIVLREDSLFTPDALEALKNAVKYRMSKGLIYSAIVIEHSEVKHLIEHQLESIYRSLDLPHSFYGALPEAKQALNL